MVSSFAVGGSGPAELQGREEQFLLATSLLAKIEAGTQALLVEGEQGVGKTAFLLNVLRSARELGHEVMLARPSSLEAPLAFAALGDLLDRVTDSQLSGLFAPQRQALEAVLLREEPLRPVFDVRAVSLAFLAILRGLAARVPVVLAIDDAQWMDVPTSEAIGFALRRLGGQPVALVATCGAEVNELTIFRGMRDVTVLRLFLEPLSEDTLSELIRSRLAVDLPHMAMLEIQRMSRGNPAIALELGRAIVRQEIRLRPGEPLASPKGLGQIARQQLAQLSDDARDAVLVAAALDQPTVPIIEAALGAPGRLGMEDSVRSGLIERDGDRLRFPQPLAAAIAYHEARPARLAEIHRLLAAIVPEPERRARHLALGTSGTDSDVATLLERSADEIASGGSLKGAADLADLAVQMTPPRDSEATTRRQLIAAGYHVRIGDTGAAVESLEAISKRPEAASRRHEIFTRLAAVKLINKGPRAVHDLLTTASAEAAGIASSAGMVTLLQALVYFLCGEIVPAAADANRAIDLSWDAKDSDLSAIAVLLATAISFSLGDRDYRKYLDRAAGLALNLPPLYANTVEAHVAAFHDDLASARGALAAARENATLRQHGPLVSLLTARLAEVQCWLGNWQQAATMSTSGSQAAGNVGANPLRALLLYTSALADAYEGRTERARQSARWGEEIALEAGMLPWAALNAAVLGHVDLVLGNAESAVEHFRSLLLCHLSPGSEPGLLRLLPDAIEALIATGDVARARQLITDLEETGRRLAARWPLASAARCRGLLAAAEGELAEAATWTSCALDRERRLPMPRPLELGRHLLVQGTIARRQKQRRRAATALAEARTTFARLGADLWLSRADMDSERLGSRNYGGSDLTPTQGRVAELVISGLSNLEVARALFITVNTVEDNLKVIYRKLGVHSRSALTYLLISELAGMKSGQPSASGKSSQGRVE